MVFEVAKLQGTYSVSLHSGEASSSRQSPSTLQRRDTEVKGHDRCCCILVAPPPPQDRCSTGAGPGSSPTHLRSGSATLARATRLPRFTLRETKGQSVHNSMARWQGEGLSFRICGISFGTQNLLWEISLISCTWKPCLVYLHLRHPYWGMGTPPRVEVIHPHIFSCVSENLPLFLWCHS